MQSFTQLFFIRHYKPQIALISPMGPVYTKSAVAEGALSVQNIIT